MHHFPSFTQTKHWQKHRRCDTSCRPLRRNPKLRILPGVAGLCWVPEAGHDAKIQPGEQSSKPRTALPVQKRRTPRPSQLLHREEGSTQPHRLTGFMHRLHRLHGLHRHCMVVSASVSKLVLWDSPVCCLSGASPFRSSTYPPSIFLLYTLRKGSVWRV